MLLFGSRISVPPSGQRAASESRKRNGIRYWSACSRTTGTMPAGDGETRHRLGRGQRHLTDPVLGTLDPRWPSVQVGRKPAAVEVTPGPFLDMVIGPGAPGRTRGTPTVSLWGAQRTRRPAHRRWTAGPGSPPPVSPDPTAGGRTRYRA